MFEDKREINFCEFDDYWNFVRYPERNYGLFGKPDEIMREKLDKILRYKREHTWQICKIPIEIVNAGKYWFNKPMKADLYIGEGIDCPEFGINGFGHSPEEIQKELQESVEDMAVLYYGFGYDDSNFTDGGALKRKWKEYLDLEKIEKELK